MKMSPIVRLDPVITTLGLIENRDQREVIRFDFWFCGICFNWRDSHFAFAESKHSHSF